jgi:hypothetical protein
MRPLPRLTVRCAAATSCPDHSRLFFVIVCLFAGPQEDPAPLSPPCYSQSSAALLTPVVVQRPVEWQQPMADFQAARNGFLLPLRGPSPPWNALRTGDTSCSAPANDCLSMKYPTLFAPSSPRHAGSPSPVPGCLWLLGEFLVPPDLSSDRILLRIYRSSPAWKRPVPTGSCHKTRNFLPVGNKNGAMLI